MPHLSPRDPDNETIVKIDIVDQNVVPPPPRPRTAPAPAPVLPIYTPPIYTPPTDEGTNAGLAAAYATLASDAARALPQGPQGSMTLDLSADLRAMYAKQAAEAAAAPEVIRAAVAAAYAPGRTTRFNLPGSALNEDDMREWAKAEALALRTRGLRHNGRENELLDRMYRRGVAFDSELRDLRSTADDARRGSMSRSLAAKYPDGEEIRAAWFRGFNEPLSDKVIANLAVFPIDEPKIGEYDLLFQRSQAAHAAYQREYYRRNPLARVYRVDNGENPLALQLPGQIRRIHPGMAFDASIPHNYSLPFHIRPLPEGYVDPRRAQQEALGLVAPRRPVPPTGSSRKTRTYRAHRREAKKNRTYRARRPS